MTYLHQVSYLRLRDELGVCLSYCCLSGTTCVLAVVQYTAVYLVQRVYLSSSKISLHHCYCCVLRDCRELRSRRMAPYEDQESRCPSSTQNRCVEYYHDILVSRRDIIGEEAGETSFECMVRHARTGPAMSTQHGLDIGWPATCDREFTIVVHINIVMSYGSSHMHAMPKHQADMMFVYTMSISSQPLFQQVLVDLQHA